MDELKIIELELDAVSARIKAAGSPNLQPTLSRDITSTDWWLQAERGALRRVRESVRAHRREAARDA